MAREQTESRPEPCRAILSGSRARETVPILGESTRLGRGDTNEITVPDA
jgi:hypothetical protein